ncbi:MAG: RagB/SusD family nutrient uptake outer membrane protein [Tannerellaceae bacterium]|jgi:hypothetical protein|nr:RagB/SusD family nutrient uptake outer membrane protein [Tannerellaceae bacterium]
MKTVYCIISVSIAFLSLLTGCSLDKDPVSQYSEVILGESKQDGDRIKYMTRAEMLTQYQAIYRRIKTDQGVWILNYLLLSESHSDNAYGGTTDNETIPMENNAVDASHNGVTNDWTDFMREISFANRVICNIDAVPDPSLTPDERKQWKAEALIFRALIMFDMTRRWGNIPLVTFEGEDITAENIEEVYPQYFPPQSTMEEAYRQIEKDLLEALPQAPDNTGDKTRFSKAVARTLLAKVYAEKPLRDYDKVVQYCDEVIRDPGFALNENFSDLFAMNDDLTDLRQRSTKESILEVNWFPGAGNWFTWLFGRNLSNWDEQFTWAKWVTPSRDLINAYEQEGDTTRLNQTVVYYACGWSYYYPAEHYAFLYKYRSSSSSFIKLRLADVILLKAEALAYTNDLSAAAALVNQIRRRAHLPDLSASATSSRDNMIDAVLHERRLELALEGHRWYDLVRYEKVVEVMNSLNARDPGRLKLARPFEEYSYLIPIPQAELDKNSNLQQNPGY